MDEWVKVTAGQVPGILGLLILIGGAWALVRGSFNKARVEELRGDNDDLRKRMKDCEDKIKDLESRNSHLALERKHQDSEIEHLNRLVTQRADVERVANAVDSMAGSVLRLMEKMDEHHTEALSHWNNMEETMASLLGRGA